MAGYRLGKRGIERIVKATHAVERTAVGLVTARTDLAPRETKPHVVLHNDAGIDTIGWGIVKLTGYDAADCRLTCTRPDAASLTEIAVIPSAVADQQNCLGIISGVTRVIADAYLSLALGDRLGTQVNSFYAAADPAGPLVFLGVVHADEQANFAPAGGWPANAGIVWARFAEAKVPGSKGVVWFEFDNRPADAAIPAGASCWCRIPQTVSGTADRWTILADQAGSITIGIWKDTYANYPPTNADSMCFGAEPAIAADDQAEDSDLSDWTTTSITAGDVLWAVVDSAATIRCAWLSLEFTATGANQASSVGATWHSETPAPPAPETCDVSDNFNRADSGTLGAEWTECFYAGDAQAALTITSNKCATLVNSFHSAGAYAVDETASSGSNMEVSYTYAWTVTTNKEPENHRGCLMARVNTPACPVASIAYYEGIFNRTFGGGSGDFASIVKRNFGANTELVHTSSYAVASGSVIKLGVSGTGITLYDDASTAASTTDGDIATGTYGGLVQSWTNNDYSGDVSDMVKTADDFCIENT